MKHLKTSLRDLRQVFDRFRRADLQVYEAVKALVLRSGGAVLPLTANFRTVPSVIGFVNDRFRGERINLVVTDERPVPR